MDTHLGRVSVSEVVLLLREAGHVSMGQRVGYVGRTGEAHVLPHGYHLISDGRSGMGRHEEPRHSHVATITFHSHQPSRITHLRECIHSLQIQRTYNYIQSLANTSLAAQTGNPLTCGGGGWRGTNSCALAFRLLLRRIRSNCD